MSRRRLTVLLLVPLLGLEGAFQTYFGTLLRPCGAVAVWFSIGITLLMLPLFTAPAAVAALFAFHCFNVVLHIRILPPLPRFVFVSEAGRWFPPRTRSASTSIRQAWEAADPGGGVKELDQSEWPLQSSGSAETSATDGSASSPCASSAAAASATRRRSNALEGYYCTGVAGSGAAVDGHVTRHVRGCEGKPEGREQGQCECD
jgi:hypothetical protein